MNTIEQNRKVTTEHKMFIFIRKILFLMRLLICKRRFQRKRYLSIYLSNHKSVSNDRSLFEFDYLKLYDAR